LKFLARCLISSNTHKIIDLAGRAGNLAGQTKQLEPARDPSWISQAAASSIIKENH